MACTVARCEAQAATMLFYFGSATGNIALAGKKKSYRLFLSSGAGCLNKIKGIMGSNNRP
jgi:hypothetical protein